MQLLLVLACAALCYAPDSWAQGRFEIRSAYVERAEGVYQLNATLDFEMVEGARAAVRDGAPFTLHLEIVVRRERSYWRGVPARANCEPMLEQAQRSWSRPTVMAGFGQG